MPERVRNPACCCAPSGHRRTGPADSTTVPRQTPRPGRGNRVSREACVELKELQQSGNAHPPRSVRLARSDSSAANGVQCSISSCSFQHRLVRWPPLWIRRWSTVSGLESQSPMAQDNEGIVVAPWKESFPSPGCGPTLSWSAERPSRGCAPRRELQLHLSPQHRGREPRPPPTQPVQHPDGEPECPGEHQAPVYQDRH